MFLAPPWFYSKKLKLIHSNQGRKGHAYGKSGKF